MNIEIENLDVNFLRQEPGHTSQVWACRHSFQAGERIWVYGPSGQGKSTFLKILFGLERAFSGSLLLGDTRPASDPIRKWPPLRERFITFVSQDFYLFDDQTGIENLKKVPRRSAAVDENTVHDWAEQLGIGGILERTPATWSAGQRQRFAILRALIKPWRWILLDEPYSNLDPASRQRTHDLIEQVCAERNAGRIQTSLTDEAPPETDHLLAV